ncbi:Hypothetical predicted protein, partial [Pelobates cultripes]
PLELPFDQCSSVPATSPPEVTHTPTPLGSQHQRQFPLGIPQMQSLWHHLTSRPPGRSSCRPAAPKDPEAAKSGSALK